MGNEFTNCMDGAAKIAAHRAKPIAREYANGCCTPSRLSKAPAHKDAGLQGFIQGMGKGAGKTAMAEGLAKAIVHGKAPPSLKNAALLELGAGALLAGPGCKGEAEGPPKGLGKGLRKAGKAILPVDGAQMEDWSGALKIQAGKPEIKTIGETKKTNKLWNTTNFHLR